MNGALFYSEKERFLFQIAGYEKRTNNVQEVIKKLEAGVNNFVKITSLPKKSVCTLFVTEASEFKNMRVFYAETNTVPEDATILKAIAWTMMSFLTLPYQRQ